MDSQKITVNANSNPVSRTNPNPNPNSGFSSAGRFSSEHVTRMKTNPRVEEEKNKNADLFVKFIDKVIGLAIIAIFFGLPLFFTGATLQGIFFEKQIYFYFWLLLALVAWAGKGVVTGEMHIRRTPLDIPIIGLWLVYCASAFFSIDRWHSFWGAFSDPSRGLMNATALMLAYYIIFSNFNIKRFRVVLGAMMVSGGIVAVWTFLGIFGIKFLPDQIANFAPLSLVGSMTSLGIFFSALVPLIVAVILKVSENETASKKKRYFIQGLLLVELGLILFLILAIYSFVSWLGLFAGVTIMLVYILSQVVRPKGSWTWLPMAVFVAVMVLRMIGAVSIAKVNLPAEASFPYGMSGEIALSALKDKPFLGSGPATYGYDFSLFRPQKFNTDIFYELRFFQGKGIVLEAMSTIGGAGSILLVILLLSYISVGLYLISREKEKNKLYSLGVFSAALVFLISSITLRVEGFVIIMGALLAALALTTALFESETKENYLSLSLKASPKYALALAFVFMLVSAGVAFLFVFLGKVFVADVYAGRSAVSVNREEAVVKLGKAIQFYPQEAKYHIQLGQYSMALANAEALKNKDEADIQKIQAYISYSISKTSAGEAMMKHDVGAVESLAQVYENAGLYVGDSLQLAYDKYQEALKLEPHNPRYYEKMGQIKISLAGVQKTDDEKKKFIEDAKTMFQKSIEEKSNFADGYYQLSLTQEALKDMDGAIENATKAVEFSPRSGSYLLSLGRLYQNRGGEDDLKMAEQIFKKIISQEDANINGHFYLGMLYEKSKKKADAKAEYRKVADLLTGDNNSETKKNVEKMISNIDAGIENTPESLGLVQPKAQAPAPAPAENQPAE